MPDSTIDKFTSMSPIITRIQLQVFIINDSFVRQANKCMITRLFTFPKMKTIQGVTRVKDGVIRIVRMLQPLQLSSSSSFADCPQWLCHASSGRGAKIISKTKVLAFRLPHFALQFRKLLLYSNPLQSLQHCRIIQSSGNIIIRFIE